MLICAHHLDFSYGDIKVLENVNIDVARGDYVVVAGPNGAGKSTLIKGLVGLKKPLNGVVNLGLEAGTGLGYMPQQQDFQRGFPASVEEIARTGLLRSKGLSPFYSKDQKVKVQETLELLGIGSMAKKSFSSLSGGQQQRVLLARALLSSKELLVLDEPTAGLDPVVTQDFYDLLAKLNKNGTALVMVSHDLNLALKDANRVLYVDEGRADFYDKEVFLTSELGKKVVKPCPC